MTEEHDDVQVNRTINGGIEYIEVSAGLRVLVERYIEKFFSEAEGRFAMAGDIYEANGSYRATMSRFVKEE
jgi:hypothetical protein